MGYLGGEPRLPDGVPWPVWDGHGPLTFVAAIDCARLPSAGSDFKLPSDGWLLFFYFDGQYDNGATLVSAGDMDSQNGSRVVYVPPSQRTERCPTPDGIEPYPQIHLTARIVSTAPPAEHPVLYDAFGGDHGQPPAPLYEDEFREAIGAEEGPLHQLGGYPWPVQGEVEYEIAHAALGSGVAWNDPRVRAEAGRWQLLAQFDSDENARMMWGDVGMLYWLIRPDDLAAHRFDRTAFTWQCC